jgi:hypothetical protein
MVGKNWMVGALLSAAALMPDAALAQTKEQLLLPMPTELPAQGGRFGRGTPGSSAASPLAFGPNFRDVFVGAGYQASGRYGAGDDGSASVGFGLGNSKDAIGLEVVVTSLSTVRSGFMDRMVAGLKAHKLLPGNTAIGVGVEGLKVNGDDFETTESVYGVISKVAVLRNGGDPNTPFSSATLSAGLGNGRFCAENGNAGPGVGAEDCAVNVFASVGLRANQWAGLIADWTGQDLNLGLSLAPFPKFPLVVTPVLADVTGTAGDGVRFTVGAGFGLRF